MSASKIKYDSIDENLIEWIHSVEIRGAVITDKIILEKAKKIALELNISDLKGSSGWLAKFKKKETVLN